MTSAEPQYSSKDMCIARRQHGYTAYILFSRQSLTFPILICPVIKLDFFPDPQGFNCNITMVNFVIGSSLLPENMTICSGQW